MCMSILLPSLLPFQSCTSLLERPIVGMQNTFMFLIFRSSAADRDDAGSCILHSFGQNTEAQERRTKALCG